MRPLQEYAVVRVDNDRYRLDRVGGPGAGAVAFVVRFRDRRGDPLGWRLKPLVVLRGSRSRIWPTAAAALAATGLMTARQAESAITAANTALAPGPAVTAPAS